MSEGRNEDFSKEGVVETTVEDPAKRNDADRYPLPGLGWILTTLGALILISPLLNYFFTLILTIAALLISFFHKQHRKYLRNWWSPEGLIEKRTLWQSGKFKAALIVPLAVSFVFCLIIGLNLDREFDYSYDGFNRLFDIFRFPLALAAIALPLTALVASNHRSAQFAKALSETEERNTASNFYDHKKDFLEMLDQLEVDWNIKFYNRRKLYQRIFPHNNAKNVDFKSLKDNRGMLYLDTTIRQFNHISNDITPVNNADTNLAAQYFMKTFRLSESLHIRFNEGIIPPNCQTEHLIAYDDTHPIFALITILKVIEAFCSYSFLPEIDNRIIWKSSSAQFNICARKYIASKKSSP